MKGNRQLFKSNAKPFTVHLRSSNTFSTDVIRFSPETLHHWNDLIHVV